MLDLMLVEERWFIVELNPYREAQDVLGTTSPSPRLRYGPVTASGRKRREELGEFTGWCVSNHPPTQARTTSLFSILSIVAAASPKIKGKA